MTKRERVLRALAFQEVDRVPVYDIIDSNALREHVGGKRITEENAWELEYAAARAVCDATRMLLAPEFHPHRSTDEDGFVRYHDYQTTWIESKPFIDLEGYRRWALRDIERARRWSPDAAYVEAYRRGMARHRRAPGDDTVILVESDCGLEEPRDKGGVELFNGPGSSRTSRSRPSCSSTRTSPASPARCHTPSWLRAEFFPLVRKLVEVYHERGVKCVYHSDGNLNPVMEDLAATGIDGINPVEKIAGMDVADVRARFPRLAIAGGIDVSQLLTLGTPEQVRKECRRAIDATGGRGFLLGSTTELLPMVKVENVLAMMETARTYFLRNP